jgi:hypothetical protein
MIGGKGSTVMIPHPTEKGTSLILKVVLSICTATSGMCTSLEAADNKACSLLTSAEIEAATGLKISGWKAQQQTVRSDAALCNGDAGTATVLLRVASKTGAAGLESKGMAIAKQMGAQVEVKTFGPVTCSSVIPPKSLEQYGFNTTCAIEKGSQVAAIEVTSKTQNAMVPIDKLRPLVEKMRF